MYCPASTVKVLRTSQRAPGRASWVLMMLADYITRDTSYPPGLLLSDQPFCTHSHLLVQRLDRDSVSKNDQVSVLF